MGSAFEGPGDDPCRVLAESHPDGMLLVDSSGTVVWANSSAAVLLDRGDPVGQPLGIAFQPGVASEVETGRPPATAVWEVRAWPAGAGGMVAVAVRDITEEAAARDRLRELSFLDELTGLYNRRGFESFAERQFRLADRGRVGLMLLFADVDDLKSINDGFGHYEGDRALSAMAEVLRETFRRSDLIARIGGDEFAVLALEGMEWNEDAMASRLQGRLREHSRAAPAAYPLSVSIGFARYDPAAPGTLDAMLATADAAMYRTKRGRVTSGPDWAIVQRGVPSPVQESG